jgi:hypothetical protein
MTFYFISELVNAAFHSPYEEGMEKYIFVLHYETKDKCQDSIVN